MPKEMWTLSDNDFGKLLKYIKDDTITDIDYNGRSLWINDIYNNRRQADVEVDPQEMENFAARVANRANKKFDPVNNRLAAQTNNLRISCLHETQTMTGISVCIRKSPPIVRLTPKEAVKMGFMTKKTLAFIINCVMAKCNFVTVGEPQVGKTELSKFIMQFIPDNQRVITIEDVPELHYHEIKPTADCVEIIVGDNLTYTDAIKTCLRQNPNWIMLSEARSTEVKYLIECWTTGVHGMTTLHTDDVRKIPDRIVNMSASELKTRIENDVFVNVDLGILVKKKTLYDGKIIRYIDQVAVFSRNRNKNSVTLLLDEGEPTGEEVNSELLKKLRAVGITDPFSNNYVDSIFSDEKEDDRWKKEKENIPKDNRVQNLLNSLGENV